MSSLARNTILIFFGFLVALLMMFGLTSLFNPKPVLMKTIVDPALKVGDEEVRATQEPQNEAGRILAKVKDKVGILTYTDASAVQVVSSERNEWPDSSLGCPEVGFDYTVGKIDGYKVVVKTTEEEFTYHTDRKDDIKLCSSKPLAEQE